MKKIRNLVCALLCVALLGALAACGGGGGEATQTPSGGDSEYVYVASYAPIDVGDLQLQGVNSCCWANGRFYFATTVQDGTVTVQGDGNVGTAASGSSVTASAAPATGSDVVVPADGGDGSYTQPVYRGALFSVAEDGTDLQELSAYVPVKATDPQTGMGSSISSFCADDAGNLWILEIVAEQTFNPPEGVDANSPDAGQYYQYTQHYYIRELDATGAELKKLDMSSFLKSSDPTQYIYLNGLCLDKDGNLYTVDGNSGLIYVISSEGTLLFTLSAGENNWVNSLVRLSDGTVGAMYYKSGSNNGANVISVVDAAAKGWGKEYAAPLNAGSLLTGNGDYDLYYSNGTSFFGYSLSSGTSTNLLTWINSDVNSDSLVSVIPLTDGRIVALDTSWNDAGTAMAPEIITMTKTPRSDIAQKTTLTYACMYLDYNIRNQIIKFNKASDKYHIEVHDYSEYNTADDNNAGLTKLSTEIISGKVPDILSTSGLPLRQYASKGLLEDLWPFIDKDTDLGGRDALVSSVFAAMSTSDGKLLQISPSFSIQTAYGAASVVGDKPGWTLDQLNAALATLQSGATVMGPTVTKSDMLSSLCYMYLDSMVDWSTGQCSFDSPTFINLLKMTASAPQSFDWQNYNWDDYEAPAVLMQKGEQLIASYYLSNVGDCYGQLGGDPSQFTFIGFPTSDGSLGSAFSLDSGLAISSKCADKDGAWSFLRVFLTEDYQTNNVWSLPTNKAVLQKQFKDAMTPSYTTDENGKQVEEPKYTYTDPTGQNVDVYAMDQAVADKLQYIIDNTVHTTNYDQNIYDIVTDECAAFFAGQKTAEDAAKNIQSRVSLYVNEQR